MPKNTIDQQDLKSQVFPAENLTKELQGLAIWLKKPLGEATIETWVEDWPIREYLTLNTTWGHIKWCKSLGRPQTTKLSDAFSLFQVYLTIGYPSSPADPRRPEIWGPALDDPDPSKWDGPEDSEHYRVSFMARANQNKGPKRKITVALMPNLVWEYENKPSQAFLYVHIEPQDQEFEAQDYRQDLSPFEVKQGSFLILPRT